MDHVETARMHLLSAEKASLSPDQRIACATAHALVSIADHFARSAPPVTTTHADRIVPGDPQPRVCASCDRPAGHDGEHRVKNPDYGDLSWPQMDGS